MSIPQRSLDACREQLAQLLPADAFTVTYCGAHPRCIWVQYSGQLDESAAFDHLNSNRCRPPGYDLRFVRRGTSPYLGRHVPAFVRASGDVTCSCGKLYREHAQARFVSEDPDDSLYLRLTCNGWVKL